MSKDIDFVDGVTIVTADWLDAVQDTLPNFNNCRLVKQSTTSVKIEAGSLNDQVGIVIEGRMRSTIVTKSLTISGSAETKDIYATADSNDRDFAIEFGSTGYTPSATYTRKIGEVEWNGATIDGEVVNLAGPATTHNTQFSGDTKVATPALSDDSKSAVNSEWVQDEIADQLGNVTNDAQLKAADLDTDSAMAADSDTKIPSQKAVKTALAGKQASLGYTAANDSAVVHLAGTETISGAKTLSITPKHAVQTMTASGQTISATGGKVVTLPIGFIAGEHVKLPTAVAGMEFTIVSFAQTDAPYCEVRTAGGDTFPDGSTARHVLPGNIVHCVALASGMWHAAVSAPNTRVDVLSASGDVTENGPIFVKCSGSSSSITLPPASLGRSLEIVNVDTTMTNFVYLQPYDGSSSINGLSAGSAVKFGAGQRARAICLTANNWTLIFSGGQQLVGGFQKITSDASPAATLATLTIDGDGITPVRIEGVSAAIRTTGAAGTAMSAKLKDGGSAFAIAAWHTAGVNYESNVNLAGYLEPFTGTKTITFTIEAAAGTITAAAGVTYPTALRATWAPGVRV